MVLSIFVFISFLTISLFYMQHKVLSVVENTFLFLIVLIININAAWIINEELNLINTPATPIPYTAFILDRSLIFPMLFVIQFNLLYRYSAIKRWFGITLLFLAGFVCLRFLAVQLGVYTYEQWNFLYDAGYTLILQFILFYVFNMYRKITLRKVML
ncbi:hypothetical protein [Priestia flexa]|uniref:hypothetical protein n=1 Tax=Priestia flexa TaxID=86664 RepID=UPI001B32A62B|nr:hypothetical protein [Priestia flexa]